MPASKRGANSGAAQIGSRVRARRIKKRLSLDQLGMDIGVSGPQIARYERGENHINSVTLRKLARALECSPLELLEDEQQRQEYLSGSFDFKREGK